MPSDSTTIAVQDGNPLEFLNAPSRPSQQRIRSLARRRRNAGTIPLWLVYGVPFGVVMLIFAAAGGLEGGLAIAFVLVLAVVAIFVYSLPSLIAYSMQCRHMTAICGLNLLLGWTFLGWLGALIWALVEADEARHRGIGRIVAKPGSDW